MFKRVTPLLNCPNSIRFDKSTITESIAQWELIKIIMTTSGNKCEMVDSNSDATITALVGVAENRSKSGDAEPVRVIFGEDVEYEADLDTATTCYPFDGVTAGATTTKVARQYAKRSAGLSATTTDFRFGYVTRPNAQSGTSKCHMRFYPPSGLMTP